MGYKHSAFIGMAMLSLALTGCNKKDIPTSPQVAAVAAPQGKKWTDIVSKTEQGGYQVGNPDAKIKVIEFASYTCSHCAEFEHESSAELKKDFINTGQISYEFRNFVRDREDMAATLLTQCAPKEQFQALSEAVFKNQKAMYDKLKPIPEATRAKAGDLPADKRFVEIARMAGLTDLLVAKGLDPKAAQACLADGANSEVIAARVKGYLKDYVITGTPTFYLNGKPVELDGGDSRWEQMREILQKAGARK
jgi:protein-disulfide isomerase